MNFFGNLLAIVFGLFFCTNQVFAQELDTGHTDQIIRQIISDILIEDADESQMSLIEWIAAFEAPGLYRGCSTSCDMSRIEVVLYHDNESASFGLAWATESVFERHLGTDYGGDTEAESRAMAEWWLIEARAPEHVEAIGSLMAGHVVPILWEQGVDDPIAFLQAVPNSNELAFYLACDVLPTANPFAVVDNWCQ